MILTDDQVSALGRVAAFLEDPGKQVFTLCGYAGTGKTTLVHKLVELVPGGIDAVRIMAPTNKAVSVLRRKGFDKAITLHQFLYHPITCLDPQTHGFECECAETLSWDPKIPESAGLRLLVVDEASMVEEDITLDLLDIGIKVLAIGDSFQLPPISSDSSLLDVNQAPDALLQAVCRQTDGSPVLDLATRIRNREQLPRGWNGGSFITSSSRDLPYVTDYENIQVIVATHKDRHYQNSAIRHAIGRRGWEPEPGDRILCRRTSRKYRLIKGEMYRVLGVRLESQQTFQLVVVEDIPGATKTRQISVWSWLFEGESGLRRYEELSSRQKKEAQEFWHGYAITAHAAQGSEWDYVIVYDGSWKFPLGKMDRHRWCYTAITRAREQVLLCTDL